MTEDPGPHEAQLTRYCRRCHRTLRDPRSMEIGYGPVCAAKEVQDRKAHRGEE